MKGVRKYCEIAKDPADDPELVQLNQFLDRLERIEDEVRELTKVIDLWRIEKENTLRYSKSR